MPEKLAIGIIRHIEQNLQGNYRDLEAFEYVKQVIKKEDFINSLKTPHPALLNMYPDCQASSMSASDPRKDYLDKTLIS